MSQPQENWPCQRAGRIRVLDRDYPVVRYSNLDHLVTQTSPKLSPIDRRGYRYYAGFSRAFVSSVLDEWDLPQGARILDPWNGSGTTTSTAGARGYPSIGFDLNPVAIVLARGRLLDPSTAGSLEPLGEEILADAALLRREPYGPSEPLLAWFDRATAHRIRRVDVALRRLLLDRHEYRSWRGPQDVETFSSLAAFYVSTLFLVVRRLVQPTVGSNPTWIKWRANEERISVSHSEIARRFQDALVELAGVVSRQISSRETLDVRIGDSRRLPLGNGSVEAAVTSPPYCTRLDYVVATLPELAVLGCHPETGARDLRRQMLGTTATRDFVTSHDPPVLGEKCTGTLNAVAAHPSKASRSYYSRFYVQYFTGLHESLKELRRVIRKGGRTAIVVQDSHYKDILIPLGDIVTEMSLSLGWERATSHAFEASTPLVRINPRARRHLPKRNLSEHVVLLEA